MWGSAYVRLTNLGDNVSRFRWSQKGCLFLGIKESKDAIGHKLDRSEIYHHDGGDKALLPYRITCIKAEKAEKSLWWNTNRLRPTSERKGL